MKKETKKTFTYACRPSIVKAVSKKTDNISDLVSSFLAEFAGKSNGIPKSMDVFRSALRADEMYFYAWQCMIAMAIKDEFSRFKKGKKNISYDDMHEIANNGAKNLLKSFMADVMPDPQ